MRLKVYYSGIFRIVLLILIFNTILYAEMNYEQNDNNDDNKFFIGISSSAPLIYDPYNFLYGVEYKHIGKEGIPTMNLWAMFGSAKPLEEVDGEHRRLYGMYNIWSYIFDHSIYQAFSDVTVSIFYIGLNACLSYKTEVFDERDLFFVFKIGAGYDVEWFDGKILNNDSKEHLGSSEGIFSLIGGEIMLESFHIFNRDWYSTLGCDVIYKIHNLDSHTVVLISFGIAMKI